MSVEKKVILIAGPTASGKSELAIKLAKYINGEIINADSMQIYKEISILTSRPKSHDLKIIKHHLYGFQPVKKKFSTGHWLKITIKKIERLWLKNKTPIVVGGTGLYFKALTDGLANIPNIPEKLRENVRRLHHKLGQKFFFYELIKLDPLVEKYISSSDSQRSLRAYEVKKFTGKSLFQFNKGTKSKFKDTTFRKLFINIPKDLLHKKIKKRVDEMFNQGVIDEAKKFYKIRVKKDLSPNKIIGVKEIQDYLKKKITLIQAKELIGQKTRQYAKRQFTWSRAHMKSWEKIYSPNINDLLEKTINKIS